MAAVVGDREPEPQEVFLVTRRELAVLTVAFGVLLGAILLLVVTSGQVTSAVFGGG